jgi:hypothetical protein
MAGFEFRWHMQLDWRGLRRGCAQGIGEHVDALDLERADQENQVLNIGAIFQNPSLYFSTLLNKLMVMDKVEQIAVGQMFSANGSVW